MRMALLGDIALFGKNSVKNEGWKERFAGILPVLRDCDYVVGNLETPLTGSTRTVGGKSAYIKGSPEDAEILSYLGVTHVSLANNHMYDYMERGLEETVSCLERYGITWYGINGKTALIGEEAQLSGYCCYSTNAAGLDPKDAHINVLDPLLMEKDIDIAVRKRLLPILSCHWGEEHVHFPNYDHIRLARVLAEKHRIVIHGHHPHVIQGNESPNGSLVHYSLGNFCFDDVYTPKSKDPLVKLSRDNQESYVLILTVSGGVVLSSDIIPFSFHSGSYDMTCQISDMVSEWSSHLSDEISSYSEMRNRLLARYREERRQLRDINWYLKRLNPESVKMILNAHRDARRYREVISHTELIAG